MKTITNIIRKLFRPALLALTLLALSVTCSHAAKIYARVWVNGVLVEIIPGSNTGGRVVKELTVLGTYTYYTDRVSRGETVGIYYAQTRVGEYALNRGYFTTCGTVGFGTTPIERSDRWVVPTNPNCDNLHAWIRSNYEYKEMRLPIGTRP